ncbi:MAG: SAM-dependent methyltransferase [Syntrophales bacterium]|jgi:tRNA-Thr(GGU) m(6)t(6)A37 methyltransferase TsaA|nr:SAM-dependent methyltransferase [Syntrophales bacterium]MDY0044230.1 SAM-dependent methyltransferase [Syntrophales bacterium]
MMKKTDIEVSPIGFVHTEAKQVPKFWTESEVEGKLILESAFSLGMKDIVPNQRIEVIFYFHKSVQFSPGYLTQYPRGDTKRSKKGVFSTRSPVRPNPLGVSVLTVTAVEGNIIYVTNLDMIDGTPILDIKPARDSLSVE